MTVGKTSCPKKAAFWRIRESSNVRTKVISHRYTKLPVNWLRKFVCWCRAANCPVTLRISVWGKSDFKKLAQICAHKKNKSPSNRQNPWPSRCYERRVSNKFQGAKIQKNALLNVSNCDLHGKRVHVGVMLELCRKLKLKLFPNSCVNQRRKALKRCVFFLGELSPSLGNMLFTGHPLAGELRRSTRRYTLTRPVDGGPSSTTQKRKC